MNPIIIILGTVSVFECVAICFLLYVLNRIIEAQRDVRTPVEPIEWENWNND